MLLHAAFARLFLLKLLPLSISNVYSYLRRHYGASMMKLFGESVKIRLQLCKLQHDLIFIRTCKREGLVPTFARIRLANPRLTHTRVIQQCSQNILHAEIKYKKKLLSRMHRHYARLSQALRENFPRLIHIRLLSISDAIVNKRKARVVDKHALKLVKLRTLKTGKVSRRPVLDAVTNLSSRVLTIDERNALNNGLHHVYPTDTFDQPRFVCNVEYFYSRLLTFRTDYRDYEPKDADQDIVHQLTTEQLNGATRMRLMAQSLQHQAQTELKQTDRQHQQHLQLIRSLAKDRSIMITRPDKGRGVVIMDRSEYVRKMETILQDPSTFTLIDHDPTIANENRLTRTLLRLKKEKFITQSDYNMARPVGSRAARLYGLPKLHKPNHPLRPVMSATKTVGYGLGKLLTKRLSHLRSSPYVIKDSFDFVRKIQESPNVGKMMVSFDVTSLFTNVPLLFTIEYILDQMYPICSKPCDKLARAKKCGNCRKRKDLTKLLEAATSETHFLFDNKMYVQHNGVAMGAPLAPVVADIFMAHMETSLMDQLMESGVCEWHRYVDDTFVLIEPTTNVVDVLNILNNFHPSIKFTYEVEANRSLPFLDVRVTRSPERQTFETTIYRKPTFTGLMTKWDSFVPMNYKKASIDSMIRRALSICSTYASLVAEFDEIRRISQANDYPISFIDTHIGMGLSRYMAKKNNTPTPKPIGCDKKRMYVEIPYIGRTTESMKKKFSHLSGKLRPDLDVRFFMKPPPSVRTFFQNKDPVAKHMQSNIVYSVNCNDCGQTYVGKTDRQAIRRMNEHGAPPATFEPLRTTKRKPAPSKPAPSKPAPSKPAPSKPAPSKPAPSKPARARCTPSYV